MLASAAPTVTSQTIATPASPSRPSRLRGLSYLRNYTHDRLTRADAPPLIRSVSTPNATMDEPEAPVPEKSNKPVERNPTIRFIPHVEMRSSRPSLHFSAVTKTLKNGKGTIRVGRYTEKDQKATTDENIPVGFKSKVVSRRHCEFWCTDGQWYVKDVKSSSGTFLNHVRLSSPGSESRPFPVNDGDVVQLGIDFKGGEEVIFRCVKIRIECNRGWQKALNNFNTQNHKKLLDSVKAEAGTVSNHECSICLNPVSPCQCLFVAPCSHVWHYKCVRNLVHGSNWPNFICPNCRYVADLEADVEPPEEDLYDEQDAASEAPEEGANSSSDNMDLEELPVQQSIEVDETEQVSPLEESATNPMIITHTEPSVSPETTQPMMINKAGRRANSPRFIAVTSGVADGPQFPNGIVPDNLLTPRNDAGPFVLDGAAGRLAEAGSS